MRPGITRQNLQAARHPLPEDRCHTVVVCSFIVLDGTNLPPKLIRTQRIDRARSKRYRLIVIEAAVQVDRVQPKILQSEPSPRPSSASCTEVPLIHTRGRQIW